MDCPGWGADTELPYQEGALGFAVLTFFLPRFFRVLDFEAQFCGFLQHHNLRLYVFVILGSLRFPDVVHGFLVAL